MVVGLNIVRVQWIELKCENLTRIGRGNGVLIKFQLFLTLIALVILDREFQHCQGVTCCAIVSQCVVKMIAQTSKHFKFDFELFILSNEILPIGHIIEALKVDIILILN